jgi:hypothetical protein
MASIGNDPNAFKRILFVAPDGKRKTIRLGKATAKQATAFQVKVEALIAQTITGVPDDEVSRWVPAPNTTRARTGASCRPSRSCKPTWPTPSTGPRRGRSTL